MKGPRDAGVAGRFTPESDPGGRAKAGCLGASPPVLFPVVTDGNEDIIATYRLFAPGATHAEFLIDRQGYIRAIWRIGLGFGYGIWGHRLAALEASSKRCRGRWSGSSASVRHA